MKTLEGEGYRRMVQPNGGQAIWKLQPLESGGNAEPSDYYYFYGYDWMQISNEKETHKLFAWDYKQEKLIDLSNQLKGSINNQITMLGSDRSFSIKDKLYIMSHEDSNLDPKTLIQVHPSEVKQVKLENSTFDGGYMTAQSIVRNGYLYLLAVKSFDSPEQGLLVYEMETGKLVYEASFPNGKVLDVRGFYIK